MELKDVILSTLAELEELSVPKEPIVDNRPKMDDFVEDKGKPESFSQKLFDATTKSSDEEQRILEGIRERLLVLFEGFQSPNNVAIEAKVDLTLNFLEYLLATIDTRLDTITGEQAKL
jgi:hypothetical protein